jgi:hypothetical protein
MKSIALPLLVIAMVLNACSGTGRSYPLGAWQLVRSESIENGSNTVTYPGILVGSEFKIWSEKNFMFVGRWQEDSVTTDNYGFGTYTLNGKDYEETVLYHFMKEYQGQKIKMTLEYMNDTLVQVYHPVDSSGSPIENISSVEKYVRLK